VVVVRTPTLKEIASLPDPGAAQAVETHGLTEDAFLNLVEMAFMEP
jgi:hypothetical protein